MRMNRQGLDVLLWGGGGCRSLVYCEYLIETVADTAQLGRKLAGRIDNG